MTGPLISVIVVVRDGERYLAAALESIFKQDYGPLDVLVVDDHSSDGTAGIACEQAGSAACAQFRYRECAQRSDCVPGP